MTNSQKMTWERLQLAKSRVGMVVTCESLDDQVNNILEDRSIIVDPLQKKRLIAIRKSLRSFLASFYKRMDEASKKDMDEKSACLTEQAQFLGLVNVHDMDVINKVYQDVERQYVQLSKKNLA